MGEEVFLFLKTNYNVETVDVGIFRGESRKYFSFPRMKEIRYFPVPSLVSGGEPLRKGDYIFFMVPKDDCEVVVRVKVKKQEEKLFPILKIITELFYSIVIYSEFLDKSEALGRELVNVIPQDSSSEALIWAMRASVELTGGDAGSITVYDRARGKMTFPYFYNMPKELSRFEVEFGKGLSSQIVQTKRGFIITDYENYPNRLEPFVKAGVKSIVGAPVIYGETVYGAVGVFALKKKKNFSRVDLAVVEGVGRIAGAILYRLSLEKEIALEAREHIDKIFFYENLVSMISSELAAPIRLIMGFSSLLKEDVEKMERESILRYANAIHSSASKLESNVHCLVECLRTVTIWEPLAPVDTRVIFPNLVKVMEKTYPFLHVRIKKLEDFPIIPGRASHMRFVFSQILRYLAKECDYRGIINVSRFKKRDVESFIFEAKGKPLPKRDVEMLIIRNCVETYLGSIWWESKKGVNRICVSIKVHG